MAGQYDHDDTDYCDDFDDFDDEAEYCCTCDNSGVVVVCIDDMCRGAGECMHGDGEAICPDCKGRCGDW